MARTKTKDGTAAAADSLVLKNGSTKADGKAMRAAAAELGVAAPRSGGDAALLGVLRVEIEKRLAKLPEDEQLVCDDCGEIGPPECAACPFCGSEGGSDDEDGSVAAEVVDGPAPDVDGALAATAEDLDAKAKKILEYKASLVSCSYDIGVELKEVRDKQMYRAKGFSSFAAWCAKEVDFTRETAQRMISIADKWSRDDFQQIGFKKLLLLGSVKDEAKRDELMSAARSGASYQEIREKSGRGPKTPKAAPPASAAPKVAPQVTGKSEPPMAPAPETGERITLLGKIGARASKVAFRNAKTGDLIDHACKVSKLDSDAYAELHISDDVVLRIGLRVSEANMLEGLSIRFVRATPAAAE